MPNLLDKPYFPQLDALRFLAFLGVYLEHFSLSGFSCFNNPTFELLKETFFYRGYMGVSLFFVISGFLITTLLMHEWKSMGGINIKNFYIRRALRIWPLYFTVLLIGFVLLPFLTSQFYNDTAHPLYYLFFAANFNSVFYGLPANPVLIPMWSLAVEEQFYLLFPLLLFLLRGRNLLIVLGLMIAGGLYYRSLLYPNFLAMGIHSITVAPDIIVGVFCGLSYHFGWKIIGWIERLNGGVIFFVYLLGLYLLFNGKFDYFLPTAIFSRLIYTLFFAFIVLEQCFAKNSFLKFSKIAGFSKLGLISYGLYCLHQPALMIGKYLDSFISPLLPVWLGVVIMMVVCLFIAILFAKISYRFIESPFLNLKRKF
jgi:peptidoglycan/LPS O-acetylase OafA/YrhL